MKKIFLTFLILLLTCSFLALPAFAEAEDILTPTEEEVVQPIPDQEEEIPAEKEDISTVDDATLSGTLFAFFEQKGDDICQYLSLVLSVVLAWLFKKGVLPSLSGSMGRISKTLDGGISAILEEGKTLSKNTEESIRQFIEAVTPTLEAISQVAEQAGETDQAISLLEEEMAEAKRQRHQTQAILRAQMDMFYQFFMAVNLPQYQKDRLGQRYTALLQEVENGDGNQA